MCPAEEEATRRNAAEEEDACVAAEEEAAMEATAMEKMFIESCETGRYLFEAAPDGHVGSSRGNEGGWIHENNKPALTADANYYGRACWKITQLDD